LSNVTATTPTLNRTTPLWTPYAAVGLAICAFTLGPSWIKFAQNEGVPSLFIVAFRMTFVTLLLTPIVLRRYRADLQQLTRRDWQLVLVAGLLTAIHFTLGFVSLEYNSVLMNEVIGSSSLLWVALLEVFLLKTAYNRTVWGGLFLALMGGILIALGSTGATTTARNPSLGSLLSLTGAVTYAFYLIVGRKLRAKISILPFLWLIYGIAAASTSFGVFVTQTPVAGYSAQGYVWVIALTLMMQLVAHGSYNYALGYISATYLMVFVQLAVVSSAVLAFFTFHEIPSPPQVIGSAAIISGVIIVNFSAVKLDTNKGQVVDLLHDPNEMPK
jgi:drug/metabolite transporter (DMT)-like permease